jgi:flavorubredoxin
MNVLILYDTVYGNTEQLAQGMARALEPVAAVRLEKAAGGGRVSAERVDLLIMGGPTHRQRMSAPLTALLETVDRKALQGVRAAAFDTRYRMPAWLTGSAARRIAHQLKRRGARVIAPPESFFMERDLPPKGQKRRHELERLEPGEVERAARWAVALADNVETLDVEG